MSALYGTIDGDAAKTKATRRGFTILETTAASWDGSIVVKLTYDKATKRTTFDIREETWQGIGVFRDIATGIIGGST